MRAAALRYLGCVLCMGLLAGCATAPAQFRLHHPQGAKIVYPDAPETPRFEYVGQLTGEDNFEYARGGVVNTGRSVLRWIVGLTSPKHHPTILQRPQGGTVDEAGRVYISDVSRAAVFVFDAPAGELRVWEMAGQNERFVAPIGVALGASGEILVTDAELKLVARLDREGKPLASFGKDVLRRPTGIARDAARGLIYVADTEADDIKVFRDDGTYVKTLGRSGEGLGEFNGLTYLAYANDELYVADTLNARVQIFSSTHDKVRAFGQRGLYVGDMPRPKGVAVTHDGLVYVVETFYDYLLVFDARGEFLLPIGGSGSGVGQFYLPAGVWTDRAGRVYIADTFNGRVVVFQFLGGLNETGGEAAPVPSTAVRDRPIAVQSH